MKKAITIAVSSALPLMAFAQTTIDSIVVRFGNIIQLLVPIFITLAVLYFFWGLIQYIKGDAEEKEKGRTTMIWGIIALFVMVSVFGLISLLGSTFGINQGGTIPVPITPR
ncbi:hypothetical protein KW797_00935 [Candidatus Parcubacteria bacterium]|nr:hypothetical protein [Candidatus Parcubacteria bacterium]